MEATPGPGSYDSELVNAMVLNGGGAKILGASTGRLKITKLQK